jgi:crotonobetainyl-CoA:carnitine CoA-transferase CaiB-like acyl-CoA transferase
VSTGTALGHVRMLDLSRQLPGPFCSTLLGDLGMDVLVVANPRDPMGAGIPFLGRNKRSMTLNLKTGAGREILERLVREADVLLEGFRPGVMDRLGVGWSRLREVNPRLVYCAISGYGQDGPLRDRVGHDINYLGIAGVLDGMGPPNGPPALSAVPFADVGGGGLTAAVGILAALVAREQTSRGQMVDVAMLDGSLAMNVYYALLRQLEGRTPVRGATQLTGKFPCYAIYETKDGRHVTIGAYEDAFWSTFCRHFGRDDFVPHQWDAAAKRDEMFAFFRAAFRTKTQAEWVAELEALEICFAPVLTLDETFEHPQVRHRGMAYELATPAGPMLCPGPPWKLSDTPASIRSGPRIFGADTDAVLASLGYDAGGIAKLRAEGVV